jgi:hypothetical protein
MTRQTQVAAYHEKNRKSRERMRIIHALMHYGVILAVFFLLVPGAIAADSSIQRAYDPALPQPGQTVDVTITLPPSFFGGIVETIPGGFTYEGCSHAPDGTRQSGQNVIFAVTGEESVTYTIRAPAEGCGVFRGTWENVGTKTSGEIPAEVITVAGSDSSKCSTAQHSPGFSSLEALSALALIGLGAMWKVRL